MFGRDILVEEGHARPAICVPSGRGAAVVVTSMPGGAADKAGNRYEHRWVVLRISEMLEARGQLGSARSPRDGAGPASS